jgi:predicted flap endonuclease-1-like 5' DNA nuclease
VTPRTIAAVELLVSSALGAIAVALLLVLLVHTRRDRARVVARADRLQDELVTERSVAATARAGEREAVWALDETTQRLAASSEHFDLLSRRVMVLETELDDLRDRLVAADVELASARDEAERTRRDLADAEQRLAAAPVTDESQISELQMRLDALSSELAAERATAADLRAELEAAHADARTPGEPTVPDGSYRERLIASEARRRDLEDRLAALGTIRAAEQRSAADRIAGLERLHLEIGDREVRIEQLESDLKQAEEGRDDAVAETGRLQVEIVRLKGLLKDAQRQLATLEHREQALTDARSRIVELEQQLETLPGSTQELERLQRALEAERARAERIARRATEVPQDTTYAMWDRVLRERVEVAVQRQTHRLGAEIDHLRLVVAEKEARLRTLTAGQPVAESPDTLPITTIRGIGEVIARILASEGVTSIADVARLTDEDVDRLAPLMPVYPGRIRSDDWVGQARTLLGAP